MTQRCFRLSLPCIPQRLRERGPGSRARNEAKERAQAAEGGAAEDAFCAQPLLDQVIQRCVVVQSRRSVGALGRCGPGVGA